MEQDRTAPPPDRDPASEALDDPPHQRFIGDRDLTAWPTALGRAAVHLASRLRRWLAPHEVLVVTLAVGLVVVAILTALAGQVYDAVTESDGVAGLDRPVLDAAIALRSPAGDEIVTVYTNVGGAAVMTVLAGAVAVGLAVAWRRWTPIVLIAASAAGSLTLTIVGKAVVGRLRPPQLDAVAPYELSASFPSGHTLNSVALAGIVAYLLLREQRSPRLRVLTVVLASAFAVTIGLSRVYLGHHWLTDVLVAWALGLAWLTVVIVAHRLFLTVRRRRVGDGEAPGHGRPP